VVTEAATTIWAVASFDTRTPTGTGRLTLKYDEVLYIIEGGLEVISNGESFVARTGEVMVIPKGVTVTYRGEMGTKVFFVLQRGLGDAELGNVFRIGGSTRGMGRPLTAIQRL